MLDETSPCAAGLLTELHQQVMRPSFPPEEYVPPVAPGEVTGPSLIAVTGSGLVVGGALGREFAVSDALLLEYLAVRPGFRGAGVGSLLLTVAVDRWLSGHSVALLELDDPRHHAPHPGFGDPAARLRFYGRFGVRLLAIPYFQPRLRAHLPRGYHMVLGALPRKCSPLPAAVPAQPITAFLREYFTQCEGDSARDDPAVTWLLDAARGPEIGLVGTDEVSQVPDTLPPRPA